MRIAFAHRSIPDILNKLSVYTPRQLPATSSKIQIFITHRPPYKIGLSCSVENRGGAQEAYFFMISRMRAREITIHAPAEFQLHRRRRRDERFGEKIDNAPPSKKLLNLRPHRSHRDAR